MGDFVYNNVVWERFIFFLVAFYKNALKSLIMSFLLTNLCLLTSRNMCVSGLHDFLNMV